MLVYVSHPIIQLLVADRVNPCQYLQVEPIFSSVVSYAMSQSAVSTTSLCGCNVCYPSLKTLPLSPEQLVSLVDGYGIRIETGANIRTPTLGENIRNTDI